MACLCFRAEKRRLQEPEHEETLKKQARLWEDRITFAASGTKKTQHSRPLFPREVNPWLTFFPAFCRILRMQEGAKPWEQRCGKGGTDIWYHMYPSSTVDMLNPVDQCVDQHGVALQGFGMMALNDDCSKLFVGFSEHLGGCVFYVMTRSDSGSYVRPVRFEFLPETKEDGRKKEVAEYKVYGKPSSMKSWVLLNADGKLYLYDVNDF